MQDSTYDYSEVAPNFSPRGSITNPNFGTNPIGMIANPKQWWDQMGYMPTQDQMVDLMTGGAKGDLAAAYGQAQTPWAGYMQGGAEDYQNLRMGMYGNQKLLDSYGNPADYSWKQSGLSPQQYYQNVMSGYSESPEAQYQQDIAMRSSNQGASASGMLGSGAYFKELQNNANDISQRDRQQYFDNAMTSNQSQQQSIQNYQQQQMQNKMMQQYLAQMGFDATGAYSGNAMKYGKEMADVDKEGMKGLGGLAGIVAGALSF